MAFWLEDKDCGSLGLAGTSEGFLGNKCTQGDSGLRVRVMDTSGAIEPDSRAPLVWLIIP